MSFWWDEPVHNLDAVDLLRLRAMLCRFRDALPSCRKYWSRTQHTLQNSTDQSQTGPSSRQ